MIHCQFVTPDKFPDIIKQLQTTLDTSTSGHVMKSEEHVSVKSKEHVTVKSKEHVSVNSNEHVSVKSKKQVSVTTTNGHVVTNRHGAVLGLCSFINAFPHTVPSIIPSLLIYLGRFLHNNQPIPGT